MPDICWWRLPRQPELGISAAMFYTASYAAMNVGAFAVVSHLAAAGERYVTLEDYAGLGRRSPLAGRDADDFPDLADRNSDDRRLLRQVLCFQRGAAIEPGWLTIIGVINSAIGAYYYLRIIV